jgi:hypothetical protein
MTKIYVHEGKEVVQTGRTAKREMRRGKVDILVEIKPKDTSSDNFRMWVRETDLFVIEETEDE